MQLRPAAAERRRGCIRIQPGLLPPVQVQVQARSQVVELEPKPEVGLVLELEPRPEVELMLVLAQVLVLELEPLKGPVWVEVLQWRRALL